MDGCKVLLCVVLLDTNRYLSCWCRAASGDMNYLGALLDLQSVPGRDVSSFHSFFKPFFPFCFYQLPPSSSSSSVSLVNTYSHLLISGVLSRVVYPSLLDLYKFTSFSSIPFIG